LAIGKDGAVVAVQALIDYLLPNLLKHLLLTGFLIGYKIEVELLIVHAERSCCRFLNASGGIRLVDMLSTG
jgi:hypothetical protein